ncbi:MAG: response regulator transcription factor [Holdemania massiliensis]
MPRILLIEDEDSIRHLISYDLKNAGYEVVGCADGASAKEKGLSQSFDIMIIDWMLPEISGIELVRLFRGKGIDSVMMMLTARDEEEDILEAFDAGVAITSLNPFLRAAAGPEPGACQADRQNQPQVFEMGGLTMDLGSREVVSTTSRSATKKEFELLEICCAIRRSFSRDNTLNEIWDLTTTAIRGLSMFIFLSFAASFPAAVRISLRGVGYKLEAEG